jgi:hypothetical protein
VSEAQTLEPGMLLLDPNDGRPQVWAVKSAGQRQATLIAHYGSCYCDAKLKGNTVPTGWRLVNNAPLAAHLAAQEDEAE